MTIPPADRCRYSFGFMPDPACADCGGTGFFRGYLPTENDAAPCDSCEEAATKRGEIDGEVDGLVYQGGHLVPEGAQGQPTCPHCHESVPLAPLPFTRPGLPAPTPVMAIRAVRLRFVGFTTTGHRLYCCPHCGRQAIDGVVTRP